MPVSRFYDSAEQLSAVSERKMLDQASREGKYTHVPSRLLAVIQLALWPLGSAILNNKEENGNNMGIVTTMIAMIRLANDDTIDDMLRMEELMLKTCRTALFTTMRQ